MIIYHTYDYYEISKYLSFVLHWYHSVFKEKEKHKFLGTKVIISF